ncbi:MAG: 16S rRNA (guanine(527)-N(7))-methyltransferase RsmG [Firmicutes bacterium]|nr:16S rRNA (guanine(527)-N(7))-methyltransferase RsmG [Bacillota bacterium]
MIAFDLKLRETLTELDIPFTDEMIRSAANYASYLLEENQKMNLTAIVDEQEMAVKHFADCLCIFKYADIPEGASLIDVGTGAGFPGMVLKIFRPDLKLTLADALKKRCLFLERLSEELEINDVNILWGRAEELGRKEELRGQYDFAAARAVASLPILLEYCTPFLKEGGKFLAMKAKEEDVDSTKALSELCCNIADTTRYELNGEDRMLITVEKIGATPDKYPRRPGMPEKKPLK